MASRVRYRKAWEKEFPGTAAGRAKFAKVGERIKNDTAAELRKGGLVNDPPAREYLRELDVVNTDRGARVLTTASRGHLVEWGTIHREADAPMRTAARRIGRFVER